MYSILKELCREQMRNVNGGRFCRCNVCGYVSSSYIAVFTNAIRCGMKKHIMPVVNDVPINTNSPPPENLP